MGSSLSTSAEEPGAKGSSPGSGLELSASAPGAPLAPAGRAASSGPVVSRASFAKLASVVDTHLLPFAPALEAKHLGSWETKKKAKTKRNRGTGRIEGEPWFGLIQRRDLEMRDWSWERILVQSRNAQIWLATGLKVRCSCLTEGFCLSSLRSLQGDKAR